MKTSDFKINDIITFVFVGEKQKGKIKEITENSLKVNSVDGFVYNVYMSKKESTFCYIVLD